MIPSSTEARAVLIAAALCACGRDARSPAPAIAPVAAAPTKPAIAKPIAFDPAAIDAWVGAQLTERGAIGASLVIVRDGKTVLAKGYGTKVVGTTQPIDADTPFAIGSISKQFLCAAALSLADGGKLSFDDRVATYYPQLTGAAEITLADLGGHVAGFRDYYPLDFIDRRMATPIAPDDLITRYATMPLDFAPRTRWSYSNTGFVVLARIVEKVAGAPYAQVLDDTIFRPLGMTSATLTRPATAATGHEMFLLEPPTPSTPEAAGWLFGAGDIWASASDLARWDLAFADGTILTEASRRAMTTPRVLENQRVTGYGCGLSSRQIGGETVLLHSGWVGGFVAYNAIIPRTRTAVVLLTNDQHVDVGDLHDSVIRIALDDPAAVPVIAGPGPVEAARALIAQLQNTALDRATLGDEANEYFDDARVAAAAPTLKALGEPVITLSGKRERGGMEATTLKVAFPTRTVEASMFRTPDGKIRQFLLTP